MEKDTEKLRDGEASDCALLLAAIEQRVEDRICDCLGFHPSPQERARLFAIFIPQLAESLIGSIPSAVFEKLADGYDFHG